MLLMGIVSAAYSQTLTVVNFTGDNLTIGVESGDDYTICPGTYDGLIHIGAIMYPAPIPITEPEAYRIGCYRVMSDNVTPIPGTNSWSSCPFWSPACTISGGPYTFVWNGCNYVEIY